jgi:hypothetical protein
MVISGRTNTLSDGLPGQVIHLIGYNRIAGTLTITPATSYGWFNATMDADGESLSLLYLNNTQGWIVIGAVGTTITQKNQQ